jgi:putative ATP-binding cassette transporter
MDWHNQLLASLVWLGETFAISLIGMTTLVGALCHFTEWGRNVKRITWDYFKLSHGKSPLIRLSLITFMTLFGVRMEVLFSFWYNGFYSAMQKLDATAFWNMLFVFAILATIHVGRALLSFYLRQALSIRWRVWLTHTLLDRWLAGQTYYREQFVASATDNPDQRIQQDVGTFVGTSLNLSMGLLDAVVSLISFSIILWSLSAALSIFGWDIPRAMVFIVYLYVIVATVFALKLGRPLVRLNFLNEQLSANFRYALIRLREYGESIAFYHGEEVERGNLLGRFNAMIQNVWAIVFRSLKFQGLNLIVSQAAVVFPFIVQAPRLLSKQISLGDVMQTAQSFGQVQSALSFFRNSYDEFAAYLAVINRLTGFLDAAESAGKLPGVRIEQGAQRLLLDAVTIRTPAGLPLVRNVNLALSRSESLLVRGPSGVGKSTLLRALAGLWPYVDGRVVRPLGSKSLFLSQKPYLPLGTLRTALHYPGSALQTEQAGNLLCQCQLGHLLARIDDEEDWTRILSLGEQQRLAIARILVARPELVFLDEASSAMDEGLEHAMYALLRESLPETILVSVGHRSSLIPFHQRELELQGDGNWQLNDLPKESCRESNKVSRAAILENEHECPRT